MSFTFKNIALLSLFFISFACGKEEIINGCTDPDSLNFSSTATNDDGSCTYLRDRYIDKFTISTTNCSKEKFYENLSVNIEADPKDINGLLLKFNGFTPITVPVELPAKVDENGLTLIADNTFFFMGQVGSTFLNIYDGIEYVGVTLSMSGALKQDGENLTGRLTFSAVDFNGNKMISTLCDYIISPE